VATANYQTVKLSKGAHRSPQDGACVMELASMLAGEPFSDHPRSVCRVIGSLLRSYNDSIDDARRQDLYDCASKVIGSRASQAVEQARADRIVAWRAVRLPETQTRSRAWRFLQALVPCPPIHTAGANAINAVRTIDDDLHADVLALVDELLEIDSYPRPDRATAAEDYAGGPGRLSISTTETTSRTAATEGNP
jgi:hypothetical protein